jgi:hypothetical protein
MSYEPGVFAVYDLIDRRDANYMDANILVTVFVYFRVMAGFGRQRQVKKKNFANK